MSSVADPNAARRSIGSSVSGKAAILDDLAPKFLWNRRWQSLSLLLSHLLLASSDAMRLSRAPKKTLSRFTSCDAIWFIFDRLGIALVFGSDPVS
jgi:hypothetical protein